MVDSMRNARKSPLGMKIIRIRMEANISQSELGDIVGSDQTRVSFWENGRSTPANRSMKELIKLGNKYGIEITLEDVINRGN